VAVKTQRIINGVKRHSKEEHEERIPIGHLRVQAMREENDEKIQNFWGGGNVFELHQIVRTVEPYAKISHNLATVGVSAFIGVPRKNNTWAGGDEGHQCSSCQLIIKRERVEGRCPANTFL